ncbi:PIN domain-containing protein [Corynebacterium doosanense]|uniref:PIN domain-containing protein n=1 Tax=Corynebacterium doosanense CAU 212 = DSM 45436 TaxID=558173 RepID=A0A097IIJ6_9CORY|nr:PIN domain-containing protein [Corynebacterium doosanense]AIT61962.1 hypothetical protein CDOO_12365 [Corynebacterium doosanense CAU 212 = DSM 45436]
MAYQSVLVDANIWVSRTLSDWMFAFYRAGDTPLFDIQWTEDILTEARYRLRKNNPAAPSRPLDFRFDHIRNALKYQRIQGYDILDQGHPDEGDWHVVNAAIHGNSTYLVTDDKTFLGLPDLDDFPFEVHTADSFFTLIADSSPERLRQAVEDQWNYYCEKRPGNFNLVKNLKNAQAPEFALRVGYELQNL